jgi:hypothetical protein
MNYLSHYFFNRSRADPHFHVGVAVPDMLSSFQRRCRPDFDKAQQLIGETKSGPLRSFYEGLLNHETGDRLFHSSVYFKEQSQILKAELQELRFEGIRVRMWFLAHIALEILLDYRFIRQSPSLIEDFYDQFQTCRASWIEKSVRTALKRPQSGQGFEAYTKMFLKSRFLEHYKSFDGVTEAVRRVCLRAKQDPFQDVHLRQLKEALKSCSEKIALPESLEALKSKAKNE